MSVNIQTGNSVKIQSGNRVLISAPGPQGPAGTGGGGTWGSITGTLADQTDLASELANKVTDGGEVGALYFQPGGLNLYDEDTDHIITIRATESTASGTLNLFLDDGAARTLTISGNATVEGINTGDQDLTNYVQSGDSPSFGSITLTNGTLASGTSVLDYTHVGTQGDDPELIVRLNDGATDIGYTLLGFRGDGAGSGASYIQGSSADFRVEQGGGGLADVYGANFHGGGAGLTGLNANNITTGTVPVANGGTGATTLTANAVLLGNGTSALQTVAPSTSGNVLTSNGTTWQSTSGFNGSVGATTPASGTFTTLDASASGAALNRLLTSSTDRAILWNRSSNTTAGTAIINLFESMLGVYCGTANNSRAQASLANTAFLGFETPGQTRGQSFRWNKPLTLSFILTNQQPSVALGQFWLRLGESTASGDPTGKSIGVRVNDNTCVLQVHNGTTLTTTTTVCTTAQLRPDHFTIQSDGAGNVSIYVNGSFVLTTTGGPTTTSATAYTLRAEVLNSTSGAVVYWEVADVKIRLDL